MPKFDYRSPQARDSHQPEDVYGLLNRWERRIVVSAITLIILSVFAVILFRASLFPF